jgi:hypothetical protein
MDVSGFIFPPLLDQVSSVTIAPGGTSAAFPTDVVDRQRPDDRRGPPRCDSINPLLATFDQSVIGHLLDPLPSANGYRQ